MTISKPCDAPQQLRYIFGKYIHPNGMAKRAIISRYGLLAGKNFFDPERILQTAIRHGYLVEEERYRDRVKRCDGDLYREMINYVVDFDVSPELKTLSNDVCQIDNCLHVPPR